MGKMKGIFFLVLTNILVIATIMLSVSILKHFGILGDATNGYNINYSEFFLYAMIYGFMGSFISLFLSKWLAVKSVGAVIIKEPHNDTEIFLFNEIEKLSNKAGIKMPEIAIYDSPDVNAFATGATRNNSLVAVSTGLLSTMDREETIGVLAHEIAHIQNGDMVTSTLIQGVMNTFVIFFAKIIGYAIAKFVTKDEEPGWIAFAIEFVLTILLSILASIVVMYHSRKREFSADADASKLTNKNYMLKALLKLKSLKQERNEHTPAELKAFAINGKWSGLFSTHPNIEDRIQALRNN